MVSNVTQSVFVPFTRTNNLTNVETNWLAVTYPGETVASTNIQFVWSGEGPTATNLEVEVDVSAVTNAGDRIIRLEYLNTNLVSLATNWISCVEKAPDGTLMSPWLPGAKVPEDIAWGEWTLDFTAATNRAALTGGYTLVALGSVIWDAKAIKLWEDLAADAQFNARFAKLCETSLVATAVIDRADPKSGASLFSHAVAKTGRSGTSFLSRNGLCSTNAVVAAWKAQLAAIDAAYRKSAGADESELLLLRADGTVVGRLNFYYDELKPTAEENRDRLFELFGICDDAEEEANNDPATTLMTLPFDTPVSGNTLHISDSRDVFLLSDVPQNKPITFVATNTDGRVRSDFKITKKVIRYTAADRSAYETVEPALSEGDGTWVFKTEDEAKNLALVVELPLNAANEYGRDSTVPYDVHAKGAADNPGMVRFCDDNESTVVLSGSSTNFEIFVERTGFTGAQSVTIDIDATETTATNACYVWEGPVTLSWSDLEWGRKSYPICITNDGTWVDSGDITFRFSNGKDFFVLRAEPREDPDAPVGDLAIADPSPAETLYVCAGTDLPVTVARVGGRRGELVGRLSVPDGTLSTNELAWAKFHDEAKVVHWILPSLKPTEAKRELTLTLSGASKDVPVSEGANRLKVCIMPEDAPKFANADGLPVLTINGAVQHVLSSGSIELVGDLPSGWTCKGIRNVSGRLPAGMDIGYTDGKITVSGIPSAPEQDNETSIWWLTFSRGDGTAAYSYPVTVVCPVKSLVSVNPGFAKSRTWSGFPIYGVVVGGSLSDAPLRMFGTLDFTVGTDGRTSAKFRRIGNKVVSFSSEGILSVNVGDGNVPGSNEETDLGMVHISSESVLGAGTWKLNLYLYADGALYVKIEDPDYLLYDLEGSCNAGTVRWGEEKRTAEAWKGIYSMAFTNAVPGVNTLCFGMPSLQVRFTSSSQWQTGRTTFAGVLPNGRTFSGSATFTPGRPDAELACLPMLSTSAADDFSSLVAISTNPGPVCVFGDFASVTNSALNYVLATLWHHTERGFPQLSYSNAYAAVGSRFTATNDWAAVWGTNVLTVCADGQATPGRLFAKEGEWRIGADSTNEEWFAVSAALNRNSGAMMGVFREEEYNGKAQFIWRPYQWKGSAMPGCESFLLGAYWYNFPTNVENAAGDTVRKTVRVGGSVEASVEK